MTAQQIINHFKKFNRHNRIYLTVRALESAGFKVDTKLNLAIFSGEI